ncbi:MAG: glucose-1-phosphate cytidylyltransferase [candidate division WS1 bacterium]|jgi:glucose-1-phosphate cytidylyltransferase|nr:glucose-1-phosphate cytidylyltransferase [candidate division WS1 bacterium]
MKVVLLVGGKGIRLAGEDAPLPKALYRIGEQPIAYHIMRTFAEAEMTRFLLTLGYRGEQIVDYFLHHAPYLQTDLRLELGGGGNLPNVERLAGPTESWEITLAHTGLESPTGERLRRVREYLADDEQFIVTYGDGLADLDPRELVGFHQGHGRAATVTVVRARSQFGHVDFGRDGTVERLDEKPPLPGWINGGFFVFDHRVFDYLKPGDSLEIDCLPRMVADGQLIARPHEGFWACMDTYKDGMVLEELWESGRAPWV